MFADTGNRPGRVEHCRRRSLRGVGLVVLAAALSAAPPATAAAVPGGATTDTPSAGSGARGSENLLAGSPRIRAVEALVPRRGRDAGRLIVWVRVDHAPGTSRALTSARPETIHGGRVVARVGKLSRFATHRLELDRSRVAHGYFLRFSKRATRALAAGRDRRVPVSLRVAQTLDLDSDGDREDRALATTTRNVPLARPATTIEPEDGTYVSAQNGDSLQVSGGAVTYYDFSIDPQCASGRAADKVQAPINPTNGVFSINDTARGTIDVSVAVSGQFTDNTQLNINGALTTGTEGPIPEPCATPLDAQFALSTT